MPITARRHIRKMRGGAQSHLLEASDGRFYIVKFQNNPQHRRILVNERVSAVLLKYLQISSADASVIEVTEEFLQTNPGVSIELGASKTPVSTGWQFGSLYPGDPARLAVYDFVPDTLLHKVRNRDDFLGALVFDKWLSNADGRQAVFFRARVREWVCLQRTGMEFYRFACPRSLLAQAGLRRRNFARAIRAVARARDPFPRGCSGPGVQADSTGMAGGRRRPV